MRISKTRAAMSDSVRKTMAVVVPAFEVTWSVSQGMFCFALILILLTSTGNPVPVLSSQLMMATYH